VNDEVLLHSFFSKQAKSGAKGTDVIGKRILVILLRLAFCNATIQINSRFIFYSVFEKKSKLF